MRRSRGASRVRNCGRPCLQPTFPADRPRLLPRRGPSARSVHRSRADARSRDASARQTSSVTSDRRRPPAGALPRRASRQRRRRRPVAGHARPAGVGRIARARRCARSSSADWAGWLADRRRPCARAARYRAAQPTGTTSLLPLVRRAGGRLPAPARRAPRAAVRGRDRDARREPGARHRRRGTRVGATARGSGGSPMAGARCSRAARPARDVPRHTAELLRALADGTPVRIARWRSRPRRSTAPRLSAHDLRDAEEALFARRGGRAARHDAARPARARATSALAGCAPASSEQPSTSSTSRPADVGRRLARHVDADLADAVSRATTGVWRRLRAPRAGALAGRGSSPAARRRLSLAAGLLWPTGGRRPGDGGSAVGERVEPAPTDPRRRRRVRRPPTDPTPPARADADDAAAARPTWRRWPIGLLDARLACAGDESCLAAVIVDPGVVVRSRRRSTCRPRSATTTLLDDFGGVAVLRVDAVDGDRGVSARRDHAPRRPMAASRRAHVAKQP